MTERCEASLHKAGILVQLELISHLRGRESNMNMKLLGALQGVLGIESKPHASPCKAPLVIQIVLGALQYA